MQNHYSLLEISESASPAEIKAAFKRLAILYHPDKHAGDEAMADKFKEINLAYQTLSKPYEKARYDIKQTYGRDMGYSYPTYEYRSKPAPQRKHYREVKIDWKENWIATAYAFGFTMIVATIVMTSIFIKNFYADLRYQELMTTRRLLFESAKENFMSGLIHTAFLTLADLKPFLREEADISRFQSDVFDSLLNKGEYHFQKKEYENALFCYEFIEQFSPIKSIKIKEHLAYSYKGANQSYEAIKAYKNLLLLGFTSLDYYLAIAEIYRDQLGNKLEAKRYFVLASEAAVKQYKSIYGIGYVLILNEKLLPPHHYRLYLGLANIYRELELYDKLLNTTNWNIQIWPDSLENYVLAAEGLLELNQNKKACENYQIALSLGYKGSTPNICIK
ncbi:MAG: curved DNA-binding protein CbpA [Cyclobacteriaceae bacterium]|jgi:curved DNA-binding protein CbpA